MKNSKKLFLGGLIGILIGSIVSVTYAIFSYSKIGQNQQLIAGDMYISYIEGNGLSIENALPMEYYSLNSNEAKIQACITYLNTTYPEVLTINGVNYTYSGSYDDKDVPGGPVNFDNLSIKILPLRFVPTQTYEQLCRNTTISKNVLTNAYMGTGLTNADKTYFEENEIIVENIKTLPYFEFEVKGKNTHLTSSIKYDLNLVLGDIPDGKTNENRIADRFLTFKFVEVENKGLSNESETVILDNQTYNSINNTRIYTSTIPANTTVEVVHTYRLYMMINNDVVIGNPENPNKDYDQTEWNNLFASVKINATGEYKDPTNGELLSEKVISRLGNDGVVGVTTTGTLYNGSGEIREYRYSGNGRYCTYSDGTNNYNIEIEGANCPNNAYKDDYGVYTGANDIVTLGWLVNGVELSLVNNTVNEGTVKNYVLFNNELWRIVGVFGDNVKIMKDTPLAVPNNATYTNSNSVEYNLHYDYETEQEKITKYGYFYWNNPSDWDNFNHNYNDWTQSGAMYYLNEESGYYGTLNNIAKSQIDMTTYYLGNVSVDSNSYMIDGTSSEVYTMERGNTVCDASVTSNTQNSNCNIWNGNNASWNGKIGLLYPSDYGYAATSSYWNSDIATYHENNISGNNWILNTDASSNWFLSPSSNGSDTAMYWVSDGKVRYSHVGTSSALRPVLNLKSEVMTESGTGSYNDPYILVAE